MTAFTLAPKLAIVLVILLVASNALDFQLLLVNRPFCRQVAVVTLRLQVLVAQPILGVAVMIKGACLPLLLGMTSLALIAIAPFVALLLVIFLVAGNTLLFQLETQIELELAFASSITIVARLTLGRLVLVAKRILRVNVMIERQALPAFFVVAVFALLAQPSLVAFLLVVLLVAGGAFIRQFCLINRPFLRQMATVTLG